MYLRYWSAHALYALAVRTLYVHRFFFVMIRRPPRSTQSRSSAASDVYKRQRLVPADFNLVGAYAAQVVAEAILNAVRSARTFGDLSLIHISEPTRPY